MHSGMIRSIANCAALALAAALLPSTSVSACSCSEPAGFPDLDDHAAVFAGRIAHVRGTVMHSPGDDPRSVEMRRVTFELLESWRGPRQETLAVYTGTGGGDCGYDFEEGAEYVVFAAHADPKRQEWHREGDLTVWQCGHTVRIGAPRSRSLLKWLWETQPASWRPTRFETAAP